MRQFVRMALVSSLGVLLVGSPVIACTTDPECDDGLVCNGSETCNVGTTLCEPGLPVTCPPPGQCELSVDCQEPSGTCVATPKSDGIICNDGVVCSLNDTCQGGICTAGPGDDVDGDGDCDADEVACGCNPSDGNELCILPNRLAGRVGNSSGEVLLQWFSPTAKRIEMATEPSCATAGVCTAGYCTAGRVHDVCTTNAQCNQPPDTCRLVLNWADVPDTALLYAKTQLADVPGFTPVAFGCSRKVDVAIDPSRPSIRLRLFAEGTVDGRLRRDRDVFRYQR